MKQRPIVALVIAVAVLVLANCGGASSTTPTTSGPFTGTWTGNNPITATSYDTLTLTQSGNTITGFDDTHSPGGTIRQTVTGTVSGNTATITVSDNGSTVIAAATLTLSGTGMSMQWVNPTRGTVTESLVAGTTAPTLTAEAYCATLPSVGYGDFFYCGTNQANLQLVQFPDGEHGFCQTAASNNLGLVGYVAYLYNGGLGYVDTQAGASALCNQLGSQCGGYIMCTRQ
jgi:hypothetical protein